jgi:dephospho-CoA kinase
MKRIGVTGGMGMGKSTCAELLRGLGIPTVDTDDLARDLVAPGQPALAEIKEAFGPDVIKAEGHLDRAALAQLVFPNEPKRRVLEAILHPKIRAACREYLATASGRGGELAVVIVPLLFETQVEADFDTILTVACSAREQAVRLAARGWSETEICQRNRAQMGVAEKIARAHHVVWTEGSLETHQQQLTRIIRCCLGNS